MSMDQTLIQRSGYTILDILSDMGGMQNILISLISFTLSILNYNYLDNYLISKLFKSNQTSLMVSKTDNVK